MKKFIIIMSLGLALAGCKDNTQVNAGRKLYKLYYQKTLVDPSSFVINEEKYEQVDNITVKWTLDYTCKNRGGDLVRSVDKLETYSGAMIKVNGNRGIMRYQLEER